MIGSALAYMDGHFQWLPALICCLFAGLMQIAANFINDLFDYLKGTDREDRLGPERACAQGWISPRAMRNGIIVTVLYSHAFVERTGDDIVLLFLCQFDKVHRVAGNAYGELRIFLRMLLRVQKGVPCTLM